MSHSEPPWRARESFRARALMRPYALVYLYRRRLRVHAAQELLAGLGVAVAVALIFAVLVANGSIAGSTEEVIRTVVGPATLQLRALGPEGVDQRMLARVESLPGVRQAAAMDEQTATVSLGDRSVALDVVGAQVSLATLDGLAHTLPRSVLTADGISLSDASARALGISPGAAASAAAPAVTVDLRGRRQRVRVTAVLGAEAVGPLHETRAAMMPLGALQRLAGLPGRITRILVEPQQGARQLVRRELHRLAAAAGLGVAPADEDLALLGQALHPSDQASAFFAVIAALLGFLFAFNAMLLTAPERRQAIADLRIDGVKRSAIAQMVLFQGLCLGTVASVGGLLAGYLLCTQVFHESPGYLAQAFVLGGSTVIGPQPVLLSLAGGILASCVASAVPLLDLRRRRAVDAVYYEEGTPGNALSGHVQRRLAVAAIALLFAASALFALLPTGAVAASVLLALATVLAVPLVLAGVLRLAGLLAVRMPTLTTLPVALTALRATTLRSLALAATGAIALFGSVALGGSRADLLHGLRGFAATYSQEAPIWVSNPNDTAGALAFPAQPWLGKITRLRGVAAVRTFAGEFMDLDGRRVWVLAPPAAGTRRLLASQLSEGDAGSASRALAAGGAIAVSQQIADERHLRVGDKLAIGLPGGEARLRIAATLTNFGWTGGALLLAQREYARLWASDEPTTLGVYVTPRASAASVRAEIARAIAGSGLEALTARTRLRRFAAIAEEGLIRLGEISTMLVVAAILAMAAGLGSAIWERRLSLSGLRLEGAPPARLRRILFTESLLMLATGCATGVIAGLYGQVIIDGYLAHVTGFPVAMIATIARPVLVVIAVLATVVLISLLPGWSASRVSPALALEVE